MPVLFKNRHLLGDKGDGSFGFGRLVVVVGGGVESGRVGGKATIDGCFTTSAVYGADLY